MGFWKRLFSNKTIFKVEIVDHKDGLDADDRLDNLIVGDMIGGFDGMVMSEIYNDDHSAETTFKVYYNNGSTELITTQDGDSDFNYYINFVED